MVEKSAGVVLGKVPPGFTERQRGSRFEALCGRVGAAFRRLGTENLALDGACRDAELKLTSVDVTATARFLAIALAFSSLLFYLTYSAFFGHSALVLLLFVALPAIAGYMWLVSYPSSAANNLLTKSAAHDSIDIGLMCVMVELNNNLYDAVRYVAEQGVDYGDDVAESRVARKLRRGLYRLNMGVHRSESGMLNEVGKDLGPQSEHLRSAMRNLDTACSRADAGGRLLFLDRAMGKVLDGVKNTAKNFKEKLVSTHRAIMFLSCTLPIMLITMLPAMGAMGAQANPALVALVLAAIVAATSIIGNKKTASRPSMFASPSVPSDAPGLPPKGRFHMGSRAVPVLPIAALVFLAALVPAFVLSKGQASLELVGVFPVFGLTWAVTFYAWASTKDLAKEIARTEAIEAETSDMLMEIKSNIEEGGSVESAICEAAEKRAGTAMGGILAQIRFNILGSTCDTLHDALFNKTMGAMRTVYSRSVKAAFRAISIASRKSAQAAARVAKSLASFMDDLKQIQHEAKQDLQESVSTIMLTARYLLPAICGMIAGITWFMARISQGTITEFGGITIISPDYAQFIFFALALFVVAMAAAYCDYASRVETGENKVCFAQRLTQTLPIVPVVFMGVYFVAVTLLQGVVPAV